MSVTHGLLLTLTLLALQASLCRAVCVEVDSDTEAVVDKGFHLGCISCKTRAEVPATATVSWYFKGKNLNQTLIFYYEDQKAHIEDDRFEDRIVWRGSNRTNDLLDGSIFIFNVTQNDSGTYNCIFERTFTHKNFENITIISKIIELNVVPEFTRGMASILSEVMMYVSIVGLQLWLVVEMIYCYRKISAAGEKALRENAEEYSAVASESKDDCTVEQEAE